MKKLLMIASTTALLMAGVPGENLHKCFGCHGTSFEKNALGKPTGESIKKMDQNTIYDTLKSYKVGILNKYGLGGLMKGQVQYNDDELKQMAEEIYNLTSL